MAIAKRRRSGHDRKGRKTVKQSATSPRQIKRRERMAKANRLGSHAIRAVGESHRWGLRGSQGDELKKALYQRILDVIWSADKMAA